MWMRLFPWELMPWDSSFMSPAPGMSALKMAAALIARMPGGMDAVALVVNPTDEEVLRIQERVPTTLWQFHGDETPERCQEIAQGMPWLKAARIKAGFNLSEFSLQYADAAGFLLDAFVEGYGGGGHVFDWSLIPDTWTKENAHRVVIEWWIEHAQRGRGYCTP